MRNDDRPPLLRKTEIVCRQLHCSLMSLGTYAFCHRRLCSVCTDRHGNAWLSLLIVCCYPSCSPLATGGHATVHTPPTPSNFHSFTFMSVLHVSKFDGRHFVHININSNVAQKDALSQIHIFYCLCWSLGEVYKHTSIKYSSICRTWEKLALKSESWHLYETITPVLCFWPGRLGVYGWCYVYMWPGMPGHLTALFRSGYWNSTAAWRGDSGKVLGRRSGL